MIGRQVDGPLRRSWVALGASVGGLGPLSGPMLTDLACSRGQCWRPWGALGAYVGGLGLLLGPVLAVLGRSRGLCRRSWAGYWASVGDLGRSDGGQKAARAEKWAKPERQSNPGGVGPGGSAHKAHKPRGPGPIYSIDI